MPHHFSPKLLILIAAAAEGSAAIIDKWGQLLNLGAIGCVLVWFMMQLIPQIKALVAALDRSTRMTGLALIALEFCSKTAKEQANRIIHEMDER